MIESYQLDFHISYLQNGADPNQTESEHHLTPIHVLCDAEYHGQSLRVCLRKKIYEINSLFL